MPSKCLGKIRKSPLRIHYLMKIRSFIHKHPLTKKDCVNKSGIYKIFNLYINWLEYDGNKIRTARTQRLEEWILHYIIEKMFWAHFCDSDILMNVVCRLYDLETDFASILLPTIYFPKTSIYPKNALKFAMFFLDNVSKRRLEVNEQRIFDVKIDHGVHPCKKAARLGLPEVMHLFLRYGALIKDQQTSSSPIFQVIQYIVMAIATIKVGFLPVDEIEYSCLVSCGESVIRVCPQLQKDYCNSELHKLLPFIPTVADDLPELVYRVLLPMTLKHACRLKIRELLYDAWQLPYGIKELPIPDLLKRYLDLCDN